MTYLFISSRHENGNLNPVICSSLSGDYMQRKRKSRKAGSHSILSLLTRERNLQSLFGGSSIVSSSNASPDPLLSSFVLPMVDDFGNAQLHSSAESISVKKSTTTNLSERYYISCLYEGKFLFPTLISVDTF